MSELSGPQLMHEDARGRARVIGGPRGASGDVHFKIARIVRRRVLASKSFFCHAVAFTIVDGYIVELLSNEVNSKLML